MASGSLDHCLWFFCGSALPDASCYQGRNVYEKVVQPLDCVPAARLGARFTSPQHICHVLSSVQSRKCIKQFWCQSVNSVNRRISLCLKNSHETDSGRILEKPFSPCTCSQSLSYSLISLRRILCFWLLLYLYHSQSFPNLKSSPFFCLCQGFRQQNKAKEFLLCPLRCFSKP